jgi:hypothetical protein
LISLALALFGHDAFLDYLGLIGVYSTMRLLYRPT